MRKLIIALLAVLAAVPAALAQERKAYSQAELDQMLAPIALYPDALLSQVLMASTYPLDIVEAARWARAHPGLQGDEAVSQVVGEAWDPSVKSLVAFPRLLQRLDENLAWTRGLGEAFLEQEPHVMETVQRLRRRAQAAGQLLPDERLRVLADGDTIAIEPADPQVVYVPCYDPWVVYGAWGWPAYPPVAWAPCPGYYAYRPGFWWGVGIGVSTNFFFGGVDWHHHHVKVVHVNNFFVRPLHGHVIRPLHVGKWRHFPRERRHFRSHVEQPAHVVPLARPMPPALSASPPARRVEQSRRIEQPRRVEAQRPQPRMEAPRAVQPRMEVQQPQRRMESRPQMRVEAARPQPGVELQRPQPRMAAPRAVQPMGMQRSQPRIESRPQMRGEARGGGNGGSRGGGWR